jgi:DMSO/TMAO reductase YedYZ molybdopterin-dependent catalytic subunit
MNLEKNHDVLQPENAASTNAKEQEVAEVLEPESAEEKLPASPRVDPSNAREAAVELEVSPAETKVPALTDVKRFEAPESGEQQPKLDELLSPSVDPEAEPARSTSSIAAESVPVLKTKSFFREQPPQLIEVAPNVLRHWTRRDVLSFAAGAIAALAGGGSLLPQATLKRLGVLHGNETWPAKEWFLNRGLRIDDDVAEALYSKNRLVPTYTKSQITPLKNNYNGATPDPGYIPEWHLTLEGLASGLTVSLNIRNLLTRFQMHEQITRLVCVEGWSAVAWWSGLRFEDLLRAYPAMSQAKWVRVESSVNLDSSGNPDPYFVSLDLPTARHPQTLLATHFNGQPLTVDHGAPLRLLVPVKLGLKNVKAITKISFVAEEPRDYWAERGYSRYDGV